MEQGDESTETQVCERSSSLAKDEPVIQKLSSHQHRREIQATPINSRISFSEGIFLLWVWRVRQGFEIRDPTEGWAGIVATPLAPQASILTTPAASHSRREGAVLGSGSTAAK